MTTPTDDDLEALVRSTLKEQAGNAPAALALQIGAHRSMTMPPSAHPVPEGTSPGWATNAVSAQVAVGSHRRRYRRGSGSWHWP